MKSDGNAERRKYARLDLKSEVEARVLEKGKEEALSEPFHATGKNIGVEGICISSCRELAPGTILDLEIFMPGQPEAVHIKGEVRWCAPGRQAEEEDCFDVGVQFLAIDKSHVALMVRYLCGKMTEDQKLFNSSIYKDV